MRLIDADKLFLHLNNWALAEAPTDFDIGEVKAMREVIYKTIKDCMRAGDDQPTAYDVDKVISEIDRCSIDNTDWKYSVNPELASYYLSRTADVVDIVKKGGDDVTLWEMLDCTLYYGKVLIYSKNTYDQCVKLFKGEVNDARGNVDCVWDYLPKEVEQWICGKGATLIYVKHYDYDNRLENSYSNSDKWTESNKPYVHSYEAEKELRKWGEVI